MNIARRLLHRVVPFRVRRALGIALFRARHAWLRRRASIPIPTISAAPMEEVPPSPVVPRDSPLEPLRFPSVEEPLVSIVIPAHDEWSHTRLCLCAVLEHTERPPYEVILADDASTDETARASELVGSLRIVRSESQLGFVANCNQAARVARGKYIVLLNNDTVVQPGWLAALVETAERAEDVAIVGGKVLCEDGRVMEAGGIIYADGTAAQYGRGEDPRRPEFGYVKEVDYVSGCLLLVRRDVWRDLGGFDETYSPGYYEDVDLAFRARRAGYRVLYQPRAEVVHAEGVSHGRALEDGIKRYLLVNAGKFRTRWSEVLEHEQAPPGEDYLARDRSFLRRRVLVVDHEVPQPDRDAGSRYVSTYVELFVEFGYRVSFISEYRDPAEPYAETLRQRGVEVLSGLAGREAKSAWFERRGRYLDVVYLHRPFVATAYVDIVRRYSAARLVYSPVDLHFVRERRRSAVTGDSEAALLADRWEEEEFALLREADVVHVVSAYEAELVRERVPAARVRTLPIYVYQGVESSRPGFEDRRNLMFVGGFLHPPNCDAVTWFVSDVMPLVRAELPGVLLFVVGSNPPTEIRDLAADGVLVTGRVSDVMLADLYGQSRIVVCPLRYGAGAKGKLVEALYHGVPVVATPTAAEGLPEIDGRVALASTAEEFARDVVGVYRDRAAWERYADTASYIEAHFSREAVVGAIHEDFGAADLSAQVDVALESARRVAAR